MNIVFRVDAAPSIGGGHLSRCLTLASKLKAEGARCLFVMREHSDYLGQHVHTAGFELLTLPRVNNARVDAASYVSWVGAPWQTDAQQTYHALTTYLSDEIHWLVVDHYGLEAEWERYFLNKGIRVGAIDDLVNRPHCAEFILDQTCGRSSIEYSSLVEEDTQFFVGERYCLLRSEFFDVRHSSLQKRQSFCQIQTILVNFGSTDPTGHTMSALKGLTAFATANDVEVCVVVGSGCPFLDEIQRLSDVLPYKITLHVDSTQVAQLITKADIAIGAAGASTWERCFLGLPTLLVKTAENQTDVVNRVISSGAALGFDDSLEDQDLLSQAIRELEQQYTTISDSCFTMPIGQGVESIVSFLNEGDNHE